MRKERTNSVCGKCGRAFALDPKVHDLRIRRIAERATDTPGIHELAHIREGRELTCRGHS
ncbi:hypothetical protein [Streptomyces acidiscabies]|uniref:Uncharacterized protein n=1 Tax=Streptomyces acidiscabies TaxID=42234 RepID=A0A0L0JD01_9ACTN|nr:hypothetical protein [Streptomyces acidiscabies]KND23349.1 hypothetical protein IQ63_44905 [Streptomyces acidiscabies]